MPALRLIASEPHPVETQTRLTNIITAIEREPQDSAEKQFMISVATMLRSFPKARPVLEALSKNAPEARVTIQAKRALAEYDALLRKARKE